MKTKETKSVQNILRKHSEYVIKDEEQDGISEERLQQMLEGEITLTEKEREMFNEYVKQQQEERWKPWWNQTCFNINIQGIDPKDM